MKKEKSIKDIVDSGQGTKVINRREMLKSLAKYIPSAGLLWISAGNLAFGTEKNGEKANYGMGIYIKRCIGCGRCADACKKENNVPLEPFFYRTWVERYSVYMDGEIKVESPNGGIDGFQTVEHKKPLLRSFFVPKLCNHCDNAPCVQVCPVGATFKSPEGVILVDQKYCIGCRYCIQACPYGARYLHPEKRVADKCTFCYHRITKGERPACVEVCPTNARVFGNLNTLSSPLMRFRRMNEIHVLKPDLNTEPKVFYANMDGAVR